MEKEELIYISYFEKKMSEIEELQKQVEHILYNKNPFYRFFHFNKAVKLHLLASEKLLDLMSPIADIDTIKDNIKREIYHDIQR